MWWRIVRGGYPDAVRIEDLMVRRKWLEDYKAMLSERHLRENFEVYKSSDFEKLISYAAAVVGGLFSLSSCSNHMDIDLRTVDRWLWFLEHMYVLRRVPRWDHGSFRSTLIKSPKLCFFDSGLLAMLRKIEMLDPKIHTEEKGALFEAFAFAELTRLISVYTDGNVELSVFRRRVSKNLELEVDYILTCNGQVVGIEVKASNSVSLTDFKGLKYLRSKIGKRLVCGIVLYTGDVVVSFGDGFYGVPIRKLWSTSVPHGEDKD